MTLPVRIEFDPSLPCVATESFVAAGKRYEAGPLDWRALGIDEDTLQAWYEAGLVAFQPAPPAKPSKQERRAAR